MISIFTTIQADLSPEFREKCSNSVIDTENLLQKIGELTGAMLITGGETPKFVGSWNSVKNTYDILSGFLLYRSLLGVDKRNEVHRSVKEENQRQSVETFRYVNSEFESEKQPVFNTYRIHNSSRTSSTMCQNNVSSISNERLFDKTLRNCLIDQRRDINVIQQARNYDGDCMDIEKLSAFYKEEGQTSNSDQLSESLDKSPSASYIHSTPIETSPVQTSLCSNLVDNLNTRPVSFSGPKRTLINMFHEVVHCDECSYSSYSKRNLLFHKARTHIRPYKCKHCGRGFGLMKDLRRHYQKKRHCKQYTFVQVSQVGNETIEEPIDLDGTGETRNFDADKTNSPTNQQEGFNASPSKKDLQDLASDRAKDQDRNDESKTPSSSRAETVSIMPLKMGESQKESDEQISPEINDNSSSMNDREVMYEENRMFLKKRSGDDNGYIVQLEDNVTKSNDVIDEKDFCIVNIKREVEDVDSERIENSEISTTENNPANIPTADSDTGDAFIDQDCSFKSNERSKHTKSGAQVTSDHQEVIDAGNSNEEDAHQDTAVVDLSQFSLENAEDIDMQSHHISPNASHGQFGKRRHKKMKSDLPYVVVQTEPPKEPELKMTFPCSYCDYSTHRLKLIDDHVKRVHFKKFECNQCGTRFGLKKDLNRHYRRTHKMELVLQRRGRRPLENYSELDLFEDQEENSVSMIQETDT